MVFIVCLFFLLQGTIEKLSKCSNHLTDVVAVITISSVNFMTVSKRVEGKLTFRNPTYLNLACDLEE